MSSPRSSPKSRKSPSKRSSFKPCTVSKNTKCIANRKVCNPPSGRCASPKRVASMSYELLTVPLLKILCKDAGIKGFSKLKKQQLVNLLTNL